NIPLSHGVWFQAVSPPHSTRFNLSTCGSVYTNDNGGAGYTDVIVYTNGCAPLGTPVPSSSGANPFGCPPTQARVSPPPLRHPPRRPDSAGPLYTHPPPPYSPKARRRPGAC